MFLVVAAGAGVVACGSDSDSGGESADAAGIEGSWSLMNIASTTQGWATSLPKQVDAPTVEFSGTSADVATACAAGSGEVEITETTVDFGSIELNEQDCPQTEKQIDFLITEVFGGEAEYSVNEDGNLVLDRAGYSLIFTPA